MSKPQDSSAESRQRVAEQRPGQSPRARRPEHQVAEADTVMFASARPIVRADGRPGLAPGPDEEAAGRTVPGPAGDVVVPAPRRGRHRHRAGVELLPALPASHPRRIWLSRGVLLLILIMQAALTLRMQNSAFEDEALYLYVGHLEIAHWLHGASLLGDYPSYFSGAPVLYPVLGAFADSIGGLAAARAVSLAEMLAATALLYTMSRRLFNERVGLCAAVIFSVAEPTLFLGHLATYDASALFLLALAAWVVVRTAEFRWPVYLLAAPLAASAVATKYASLLFVPCVIALAGVAAWPRSRRKALIAPVALALATAGVLAGTLRVAGPDYWRGIESTTLARVQSTASVTSLLWDITQWIGLPFALAVIGAVAYTIRPATETGEQIASAGSRLRRAALGAVMAGSALLAPAEQIRIHTVVSLQKHVGFGLLFAAPIAGVGMARIIGDHFRRAQIGIAMWGAALVLGMTQANDLFNVWPNSTALAADMAGHLRPGAHYLVEADEVPIYYLRRHADAQPNQFTSTYNFGYVDKQGRYLTGDAAYVAAIQAGYFQIVTFDYGTTPAVDTLIAHSLAADPHYRLADVISETNGGRQYVWIKST
ncbi:MAG TPA: glycosyltransferase family 39 protein [Streptosporangiaceae bacterium]